jgi:AmiR/NasT family two-component response regulator
MAARSSTAGNGKLPDTSSLTAVRAEIHQATGIVSVQLGVTLTAALDHLQSYAHAHQRSLGEIAADVVAHRLHFNPEL